MTDSASPAPAADETTDPEERRDTVSILGSSLLQPIADHIDQLLLHEARDRPSHGENGYAAMLVVEFNILLESYIARLRYTRKADVVSKANLTTQLSKFFADLPDLDKLEEVYVAGKAVSHNHVWRLVEDWDGGNVEVLVTPGDLGMASKKDWERIVDMTTRKTKGLALNVVPTAVDRHDVRKVFEVVWATLKFMASENHPDTPIHPYSTVKYRKKHVRFQDLLLEFTSSAPSARPTPGSSVETT
jgi:hypothetical protein